MQCGHERFFKLPERSQMRSHFVAIAVLLSAATVSGQAPAEKLSPAEQRIAWAKKAIEKNPARVQSHNDLALALARRARETSNPVYYQQAEEELAKSLRLAPANFDAEKIQVWVLLGQHKFAQAQEKAKALNRRAPDDVLVYGMLADAQIELGNYPEAEAAVQWMLDLRPGNVPALTRAAYLRELFGDIEGAVEFMNQAYERTPHYEVEDRAWILTQVAHLELLRGRLDTAEKVLLHALKLFPEYHYALANFAKVRAAQKKYPEAVDLLQKRFRAAPHPENLVDLAVALEKAGRRDEAKTAYAEFEQKARAEMEKPDNSNRELVFYYADHAGQPAEALRIARSEIGRRKDVHTLDAYAWALYVSGEYAEARKQMETALGVGIQDAKFFYHAGTMAAKLGDSAAAQRYLQQSLDLNPVSEVAGAVGESLAALKPPPGQS